MKRKFCWFFESLAQIGFKLFTLTEIKQVLNDYLSAVMNDEGKSTFLSGDDSKTDEFA